MSQQKSYAIRCSTEEQEDECEKYGFLIWRSKNKKFSIGGEYPNEFVIEIITYEEAIDKGLLGECKKCNGTGIMSSDEGTNCYCDCSEGKEQNMLYERAIEIENRDFPNGWVEPQQNEVQEVKSVIITKEDEIALGWSESPSEVQKTQEEITADEQMEINEIINEESPSEDWIDRTYKKLFGEIGGMTKENFRNTISKESPSEDNLVEKQIESIMKEIDKYGGVEVYTREGFNELLKKYLLSK